MSTSVTRSGDARITETPNAVMSTLVSPELTGATNLSVWRVHFGAEASGPVHAFDQQQVWLLETGLAELEVDGVVHDLGAGDAIQLAAGAVRQVRALEASTFVVCGSGFSRVIVAGHPQEGTTPAWIR